ncbi:Vsp/OspC family lipoprotein [Borrelia puertoricensis]|uniref:Vsp/OspC family lipoprotein n=1 Tax=Borrelia puertoricensis TaxID=2756107 RepID=UPI003D31E371
MKRITLCALLMTLFLLLSCNNSGKNLKDDEVAKSDGSVIDLAKITKNITDSVAFAKDVKEVHSLVKSIDDLAKAIGAKIKDSYELDTTNSGHNGALLAGVFQVILTVETKLKSLKQSAKLPESLKAKVTAAEQSSKKFLDKLKGENAALGKEDASDADAKKAIDKNDNTGGKGKEELGELNTAIDALLTAADAAVTASINELTTSSKPANT